jgi:hypothetical protein
MHIKGSHPLHDSLGISHQYTAPLGFIAVPTIQSQYWNDLDTTP